MSYNLDKINGPGATERRTRTVEANNAKRIGGPVLQKLLEEHATPSGYVHSDVSQKIHSGEVPVVVIDESEPMLIPVHTGEHTTHTNE